MKTLVHTFVDSVKTNVDSGVEFEVELIVSDILSTIDINEKH